MAYASERFDVKKFREMLAKLSENTTMKERDTLLIQLIIVCLDAAIVKEYY